MTNREWTELCPARDFKSGIPRGFVVNGRAVAVVRLGEAWHAFTNRCPHNGQRLDDGSLVGTILTCRWHGWRFDVATGLSPDVPPGGEGPRVRTYPVRVEAGLVGILVDPL